MAFYENYAKQHNCVALRMDTNIRNTKARNLYKKLGYEEIGSINCIFNGIPVKLKMEKMHVKPDAFHFIGYDNIKNVTIKKYALLNNKTKKVIIKTKDGKTHYLVVNLSEPALAYHDAAFAAFLQKYAD